MEWLSSFSCINNQCYSICSPLSTFPSLTFKPPLLPNTGTDSSPTSPPIRSSLFKSHPIAKTSLPRLYSPIFTLHLTNRARLHLLNILLHRLRNHPHIPRSKLRHYVNSEQHQSIIKLGSSFSSDITGDGPTAPHNINQHNPIFNPSSASFIPWSSFSTWHYAYSLPLAPSHYVIIGKYTNIQSKSNIVTSASIYCPALNKTYKVSPDWIHSYGSQTLLLDKTIISATMLKNCSPPDPSIPIILEGIIEEIDPAPSDLLDANITEFQHSQLNSSNFGISSWNVNGISINGHLPTMLWLSQRFALDINALIDTRHSSSSSHFNTSLWKSFHPSGSVIHSNTSPSQKSGGSMLLLNGQWAQRYVKSYNDPSDLGIVHDSIFRLDSGLLHIIVVYWPILALNHSKESHQLEELLSRWLHINRPGISSEIYIKSIIQSRLKKSSRVILVGDLNTTQDSARSTWLKDSGFHDAHAGMAPFYSRFSGLAPTSKIDYVYSSHPAVGSGHSSDTAFLSQSDHCPIWGMYSLPASLAPTRKHRIKQRFKPINYKKDDVKADMLLSVQSECSHTPVGIDPLNHIIDTIVFNNRVPVRKRDLHCWTPSAGVDFILLAAFQKIRNLPHRFLEFSKQAKKDAISIGPDGQALWDAQGARLQALLTTGTQPTQVYIDGSICYLRKALPGRRRQEKLDLVRETRLKREDPRFLFKGLGPRRETIDLSRLVVDNVITTDPEAIHTLVTNNFASIFSTHIFSHISDMWYTVQSYPSFLSTFNHPTIPTIHKQALYDSIHSTSTKRDKVLADLANLRHGPSFLAFHNEIKLSSPNSAPGRTGLSYKMLKHQSSHTIQQIYNILHDHWDSNSTPEILNHKLLYLLPKKPGDNSLGNIRPIVLIETLRKIWVGAIVRQIRHAWEKHQILHPTQYGFRARRSCSSCLVQLINLTESAKEHDHPLFFSSWDLRKAFDSVPRPIIQLALCRLGVPLQLANYLSTIDLNDHIQPCTPFANSNPDAPSFTTHRGTGQGDKGSPSIWVAVMDLILTAVDATPSDLFYQGSNGSTHTAKDLAYADDFVSFARSHDTLQAKANIFSATATLLGLEIATDKFRTGVINSNIKSHPDLLVYSPTWVPIPVSYSLSHITLKYLGSNQDLHNSTSSELARLKKIISSTIQSLRFKIGSTKSKIRYITGALFPMISYPASFTNCSLKELQSLDQSIKLLLKSLSNVAVSWPNDLLYSDSKDGGLGLPRLSDYIQSVKISIIQRSLLGDSFTRNAMDAILHRQCRSPFMHSHLSVPQSTGMWLSSVASYLQEENLSLCISSRLQNNHLDVPIRSIFPTLPPSPIQTISDIVEWHDDLPYLIPISTLHQVGIPTGTASWSPISIQEKINDIIILPSNDRTMIAPGQHWLLSHSNLTHAIITITGWSLSHIQGWMWSSPPGSFRTTKPIHLTRSSHINIPWSSFLPTHKVIMHPPTRHRLELTSTTILFIASSPTFRPTLPIYPPFPEAPLLQDNETICTDGSWSQIFSGPFDHQQITTAGAAVAIMDHGYSQGFSLHNHLSLSNERAFTQETLALYVGLSIHRFNHLPTPVYSDCLSLVNLTNSSLRLQSKPTRQLVQFNRALSTNNNSVAWVPAHQEAAHDQSIQVTGNIIADKIADGRNTSRVTALTSSTLLNIARWTHLWFIGNEQGPALMDIAHQRNHRITSNYYSNRPSRHPHSPPQHSVTSLIRIHQAFSSRQRGAILKLILYKFDDDRILLQWLADKSSPSPILCICGCNNTLASWTGSCCHDEVTSDREVIIASVSTILSEFPQLQLYISSLLQSHLEPIWRGIWSQDQSHHITTLMVDTSLSLNNWVKGKKLMDKVTRTITEGSLHLHSKYKTPNAKSRPTTYPSNSSIPNIIPPSTLPTSSSSSPIPPISSHLNNITSTPNPNTIHAFFPCIQSPSPTHIPHSRPQTCSHLHNDTCKDLRNHNIATASFTPSISKFFSPITSDNHTIASHPNAKLHQIIQHSHQRLAHMHEFLPINNHTLTPSHTLLTSPPTSLNTSANPANEDTRLVPVKSRSPPIRQDLTTSSAIQTHVDSPTHSLSCVISHPAPMLHQYPSISNNHTMLFSLPLLPVTRSPDTNRSRPVLRHSAILELHPLTANMCNIVTQPPCLLLSVDSTPSSPHPFIPLSTSSTPPSPSIT